MKKTQRIGKTVLKTLLRVDDALMKTIDEAAGARIALIGAIKTLELEMKRINHEHK